VFGSQELTGHEPVLVGKSGDWVALRTGPWTIWLTINKDGKFPDLSRHIMRPDNATARCQLSPEDVEFLAQTLPRLPCDETYNYPITLDLNGSIAIRARAANQPRPTEVVLASSTYSGEPVRINMNRKFLTRAVKLGFRELCVYGTTVPVVCHDDARDFVWATLDAESAIKPADDAIRIESTRAGAETPVPKPEPRRRTSPVPEPVTNSNGSAAASSNGHARTNGQSRNGTAREAGRKDIDRLIEQAEKIRAATHDLMHQTGDLVKSLKQHRRQSRAIQNTLSSLRQLKGLGV
jgi:hypothetical protein